MTIKDHWLFLYSKEKEKKQYQTHIFSIYKKRNDLFNEMVNVNNNNRTKGYQIQHTIHLFLFLMKKRVFLIATRNQTSYQTKCVDETKKKCDF